MFEDRTIAELLEEERAHGSARAIHGADGTAPATLNGAGPARLGADAPLEDVVRAHVRSVWERHGRNGSEAARILGISRNTLRAKLG